MGKHLNLVLALTLTLFTSTAFGLGTVTITKSQRSLAGSPPVRIVTATITADASAATVPNSTLTGIYGCLMKVITNPGSTAPTDDYDIDILDVDDSTASAVKSLLLNRDTANTEVVYPLTEAGGPRIFFQPGNYTMTVANNSVNSATVVVKMFFTDCLH